jgi:hypothetical protein
MIVLALAEPAWACSSRTSSWWDWDRCYCGWRVLLLLVLVPLLTWGCLSFLFLNRYLQRRRPPLWPREAFWRAVAWDLFLVCAAAVVLFAGLSDEWRQQWRLLPSSWNWLDRNWLWIAILAGSALVSILIVYFTRRPAAKADARRAVESAA